jgi:hypothetical protein
MTSERFLSPTSRPSRFQCRPGMETATRKACLSFFSSAMFPTVRRG